MAFETNTAPAEAPLTSPETKTSPTMAERCEAHDWSRSPLGPRESWPEALQIAFQIMMSSRFPMFIWWGPELINLYNDSYVPMLGKKHPASFARPARDAWYDIWEIVGAQADLVINQGQATWNEETLLVMERYGYREETYFTWSYSPIGAGDHGAAGLFCAVTEDTSKVIGQRRLKTLRELATETADLRTPAVAFSAAAEVLARNSLDLPFALLYELDAEGRTATLAGSAGCADCGAPPEFGLDPAANPWSLDLHARGAVLVGELDRFFANVPSGPWPDRPIECLILPFADRAEAQPAGFLIAGISRYIKLDDEYRGFLSLVSGYIGTALANSRAYEMERRRAEALAEIDRAKTAFFSNVSHEFRTPLTLMLGPLEDMAQDLSLSGENQERLETAHRNALRLLKLVNSLLDFARIEAGRIQATFEPVDLAALTTDIASVFRSAVERAGLKLLLDAPSLAEPIYVDREMWEKIVLNLLSNALKFTFDGQIEVSLHPSGGGVQLAVSDTGIGIPADELPKIFERFHRVRGARGRSIEGSGIGLALIQELARLHGGTVSAESEVGRGSRFTVFLPFGRAHVPADRIVETPGNAASIPALADVFVHEAMRMLPDDPKIDAAELYLSASSGRDRRLPPSSAAPVVRARILVADDNADMRAYAARLLGRDYEVSLAADGVAALESVRANPPDLVLTDVMMPRLDGFGLLRALRENPDSCEIPIILLTARAGEEARIEGLQTGADEYLIKPFSARELLARVEATLKLQRVRRESNRALRESERQYRTLFNSMEEGFCTFEVIFDNQQRPVDLRFLEVNANFERQTGLVNAKGRLVRELAPALEDHWYEMYGRIALTGEPTRFENEARQLGRYYDVYAFRIDEPELRRVAVIFNDMTERRKREEQLRQANKDLEQFAYSASHDLQEPIRTVSIYTGLLGRRHGQKLDGEALQFLEFIRTGANRMERLIQDLLAYTQVVKLEAPPQSADCNEALQAALANLERATEESGAAIESEALPRVLAHPIHLQQLFQNLVGNAIKYRAAGRAPVVRITVQRQGDFWAFAVEDNGIGIDPRYKDTNFGIFKRLHASDEFSGTGIGLAICQRIVERNGGRIWVESQLGQGSTFRFTLPA